MELSTKLFRRRSYRWGAVCFLMCFLFFNASVSVVTAGPEGAQVAGESVIPIRSGDFFQEVYFPQNIVAPEARDGDIQRPILLTFHLKTQGGEEIADFLFRQRDA